MSVPPPTGDAQPAKKIEERESVVIRFAGDSGDGMQLTGMQFTTAEEVDTVARRVTAEVRRLRGLSVEYAMARTG